VPELIFTPILMGIARQNDSISRYKRPAKQYISNIYLIGRARIAGTVYLYLSRSYIHVTVYPIKSVYLRRI